MDNRSLHNFQELDKIEIACAIECDSSYLNNEICINKNDFTIISQNIRSIYHNFDDFLILLSELKFSTDVIILTECRLNTYKPIPQLNNYHSYITTCQLNQNDGVVVYIKNTLKHQVKEIKLAQASCLQLDVLNNVILCIYRSPSHSNIDTFIKTLGNHLDSLCKQQNIIIAGDININIKPKDIEVSQEHNNRITYLDMLAYHGILPGHILPTRDKNSLDHFMLKINNKKLSALIAVIHTSITDHYTTFLALSKIKNNVNSTKSKTIIDYDKAQEYLQRLRMAELLFCNDPNLITKKLIQFLTESLKLNTTIKKIPNSKQIIKPWITPGILRCIRNRNRLQKLARKDPHNEIQNITYTRYRNYCNNLIRKIKRKYESEIFAKSVKNNKLLWKNIKKVTYSDKPKSSYTELFNIKSSPSESINFINRYFVNIGRQLAQQIKCSLNKNQSDISYSVNFSLPNSFVLLDADIKEVNDILMNLKSDSTPGWDNIPTNFLKIVRNDVTPVITHLANNCFKQGIFPDLLKKSIITPVHKGGNRDDVSNYRPISVLPAISKIIEKLLNNRLLTFLNKYNILSAHQFGFRYGKCTEDAIAHLSSLVVDGLDQGKKCMAIFLDIKKAFDTVSVPILVYKLERIGLRGASLNLIKNYLSNRKQKVKLDQHVSSDLTVEYGVPQGSVLGPTLFLLYINDLCNLRMQNAKIISYADDTVILFTGDTWEDVRAISEKGMTQVAGWLNNNLLTLNTDKTKYICFSIYNTNQPAHDYNIKIHLCKNKVHCSCPAIEKVTSIKYLGVIIDQRLSWQPHIEQVINRTRKLNWIFRTLRHVVPKNTSKKLVSNKLLNDIYVALVQSILVYCITVWGGAAKTKFIHLERAQRGLIKIMYFKKKTFPTIDLYRLSNLLSVRKLYVQQSVIKKHKTIAQKSNDNKTRRKNRVVPVPQTNTLFARMQLERSSCFLYNKINKKLEIYNMQVYECKKQLTNWLKTLTYEEVETLIQVANI